jgi:hypothetical protein
MAKTNRPPPCHQGLLLMVLVLVMPLSLSMLRPATAILLDEPLLSALQDYLPQLTDKPLVQVVAQVIVADYDLLRQDHPELRGATVETIDRWLLDQAAFFRATQLEQGAAAGVHGAIPLPEAPLLAPGWASNVTKRSVLVSTPGHRWVDIKGTGTDEPRPEEMHRNGVLRLDEALREFFMTKIVRRLAKLAATQNYNFPPIVDAYAVLEVPTWHSAPVSALNTTLNLGILVRQPAPRRSSYVGYTAPLRLQKQVELFLNHYGITTTSDLFNVVYDLWGMQPKWPFLLSDIQCSSYRHALIDFNLYRFFHEDEIASFPGTAVYPIEMIYGWNRTQACLNFTDRQPVMPARVCQKHMKKLPPLWTYGNLTRPPPPYDLGLRHTLELDLGLDISPVFPAPHRAQALETLQSGIHAAEIHWPGFFQAGFKHLLAALAKLPPPPPPSASPASSAEVASTAADVAPAAVEVASTAAEVAPAASTLTTVDTDQAALSDPADIIAS